LAVRERETHGRQCKSRASASNGLCLWARFLRIEDSLALTEAAQRDGMMLPPGTVFHPHLEHAPWMRFNVAVCEDTRVQSGLQRLASSVAE
jgi:DNA-binding transcriptional MocR family regulator